MKISKKLIKTLLAIKISKKFIKTIVSNLLAMFLAYLYLAIAYDNNKFLNVEKDGAIN